MGVGYFITELLPSMRLGTHAFGLPGVSRRLVRLQPHSTPAAVLDSGGGILSVTVTAQTVRANLGDAERYIYEVLRALATSEPGELGYEDNRGNRHVYGEAICVGGLGEVHAYRFVSLSLEFICPEKSSEPAWQAPPGEPAAYAGRATLQDYAAGGIPLGRGGRMAIRMVREYPLREIPRARGAREGAPYSGAEILFEVTAVAVGTGESLATEIEDLQRSISGTLRLTANGNAYERVLLESARPGQGDLKHTEVAFVFAQDIGEGGVGGWPTTTTAAPATTTTAAPTTTTTTEASIECDQICVTISGVGTATCYFTNKCNANNKSGTFTYDAVDGRWELDLGSGHLSWVDYNVSQSRWEAWIDWITAVAPNSCTLSFLNTAANADCPPTAGWVKGTISQGTGACNGSGTPVMSLSYGACA